LVDPYGRTAFADKTNSGRFSGHENLPWSEISGFIPKLTNLQDLFVSRPLSEDEIEMRDKYRNLEYNPRYGRTPFGDKTIMEYFGSPREVELFLEINSPTLTDEDYASLTPELKKKYIALGIDLTPKQIASSEAAVLNYYAKQKIEKIKNSSLNNLSSADIALLNMPMFAKTKESLKEKFAEGLTVKNESKFVMNGTNDGNVGRFIGLYGFDEIFEALPQSLVSINIVGDGPGGTPLTIPRGITRFKNLNSLTLQKNAISELPDYICELKDLSFLGLTNNPELTSLPECIGDLEDLDILNLSGTNVQSLPKKLEERMTDMGNGIYNIFDF
jgi:Leucine-rich repeat (LRR) protein